MKTDYIARRPDPSVAIDKDRISQLAFDCNSYPVLVYALLCRGFKEEEIKDLLTSESPGGKILSFPLNMTHMASAIILRHLQLGNKIGIFADYDCDGITSGYVMKTGLEQIKDHIGSRSIIALLMAIELMLLSVSINFVAFSHYLGNLHGQVFALFIMTAAAAGLAIGLAILVLLFRRKRSINVDELMGLKG